MQDPYFVQWFDALQKRHLKNLRFAEVRRAVQALSASYIDRRADSVFTGAGKRAAFSLFYAPLHFLLVSEIIRSLGARVPAGAAILDLGCGTGAAGAAWALAMEKRPEILGIDRNPWVLQECRWTFQHFALRGKTKSADLTGLRIPAKTAVVVSFTINELDPAAREHFHDAFLSAAANGAPVLVIEPVARRLTPWWDDWSRDWIAAGGRSDEWRFRADLPEMLALMDRAAGLDHRELTGRSLWLPESS